MLHSLAHIYTKTAAPPPPSPPCVQHQDPCRLAVPLLSISTICWLSLPSTNSCKLLPLCSNQARSFPATLPTTLLLDTVVIINIVQDSQGFMQTLLVHLNRSDDVQSVAACLSHTCQYCSAAVAEPAHVQTTAFIAVCKESLLCVTSHYLCSVASKT